MKQIITYDELGALLILDKNLETLKNPEPIRCQENLEIIISFEEYCKFLDFEIGYYDCLGTPILDLQKLRSLVLTESNNDNFIALFKAFARDVTRAMLKELWFSVGLGKNPTQIKAQTFGRYKDYLLIDDHKETNLKKVIQSSNLKRLFQDFAFRTGYSPQKILIKDKQINLYERAMVVWYLSLLDKVWTFS